MSASSAKKSSFLFRSSSSFFWRKKKNPLKATEDSPVAPPEPSEPLPTESTSETPPPCFQAIETTADLTTPSASSQTSLDSKPKPKPKPSRHRSLKDVNSSGGSSINGLKQEAKPSSSSKRGKNSRRQSLFLTAPVKMESLDNFVIDEQPSDSSVNSSVKESTPIPSKPSVVHKSKSPSSKTHKSSSKSSSKSSAKSSKKTSKSVSKSGSSSNKDRRQPIKQITSSGSGSTIRPIDDSSSEEFH